MRRTVNGLRMGGVVCWAAFAWAIAAEVQLLPRLADWVWLRWQVLLLGGLVLRVSGERLAELQCRCCGAREVFLRSFAAPAHELLCRRCLHWDVSPEDSSAPLREHS